VTTIGGAAFMSCSGFNGILTIPNSVTTIGSAAFSLCTGFTGSLTIPNSVTTIASNAFERCVGFTEIIMFAANPPSLGANVFVSTNFPIYVPYESLNEYETATYWRSYQSRIYPMAYKTISGYDTDINSKWTFIASPLVESTTPKTVENLITEMEYDLYQFNPLNENGEWENYKVDSFNIINGKGYLYANRGDINVIFKGEFNENEMKEISLDYDDNAVSAGWNLVGNPFPVSACINREYYVLNENGTGINSVSVPATTPIPSCTAVFVKAVAVGDSVVFTRVTP
jgi:hypothetical protein